jgi:hypothetical protein
MAVMVAVMVVVVMECQLRCKSDSPPTVSTVHIQSQHNNRQACPTRLRCNCSGLGHLHTCLGTLLIGLCQCMRAILSGLWCGVECDCLSCRYWQCVCGLGPTQREGAIANGCCYGETSKPRSADPQQDQRTDQLACHTSIQQVEGSRTAFGRFDIGRHHHPVV